MAKTLVEQAIMLADYGAEHGNFMYNWVGIEEMKLDLKEYPKGEFLQWDIKTGYWVES